MEPLKSAIMTGYNLRKAVVKFEEYAHHALECLNQVLKDSEGERFETYAYEVSEARALIYESLRDVNSKMETAHKLLAELNRDKGFDQITKADFLEHGVIGR